MKRDERDERDERDKRDERDERTEERGAFIPCKQCEESDQDVR